jgi:acyl carrier protein
VQKKVLLLMFIERELGIAMEDDEASDIENLDELADAVIRHLKGGK